MSDELQQMPMTRRQRRLLRLLGVAVGAFALAFAFLIWYTQTESFRAWAQRKVVAALEQKTGGRVELRKLTFSLRGLRFQADGLVIHGREAENEKPYLQADQIVVDAKVLSWFGRQLRVRSVVIESPRIHLIVYPDGSMNVPEPPPAQAAPANPSEPLFDVRLDHAELRNGTLLLNDRPIPFDFSADGIHAAASYSAKSKRYDGSAKVDKVRLAHGKWLPAEGSGSARFSVSSNEAEIESLDVSSGKSTFSATGKIKDFTNPTAEFQYTSEIDAQQAGSIFRLPEFRRGTFTFKGTATYARDNIESTGKTIFKGVEYRDSSIFIPGIEGGAEYTADKNRFSAPHVFARALNGIVTGDVEIKYAAEAQQQGLIRAKVDNISVARLASAASTRNLPFERLQPAGTASGTVDVSWRGTPSHAVAQFALSAKPSVQGALPVTAQARGSYSLAANRFDFETLEASGRSMHATASGTLDRSPNLKISATGSLQDVAQVLRAWGEERLPAGLAGDASFTGTISGTVKRPLIAGHLELARLDVPVPLQLPAPVATVMKPVTAVAPPHPGPGPRTLHYDAASADIQYSPSAIDIRNGVVRRGTEQLTISATIGLVDGVFLDTDPLQANLSAKNFRAEELMAIGGYSLPVTGVVNAVADLHGTKDDPRGSARFQLADGTMDGLPVKSASASVNFINQEAQFSNVSISQDGARVTGGAQYNLRTTAFRFSLIGTDFHLSEFKQLQGTRVRTSGTLNFVARGSGTQTAPVIDADVNLRDVTINGQRVGDLSGTATTTRGVMRVEAHSASQLAQVQVNGTIVMRNNFDSDLTLKIARIDGGPLLQMALAGRFQGRSELSGTLHLAGPLRQPELLTVEGNLGEFMVAIENVKVQNEGPLKFVIADDVLRLEQFKLSGTDTTFAARGTVDLAGSRELDLRAEGRINLGLIQSFNTDLHASGAMNFDMRAAGTILRPTLFGTVKIENGTVTSINFPTGISGLNGTLVFNQDRGQIQQLSGTVGGGAVNFGGFVSYGNGLTFDVTAAARDVRVRYPQGFSETIDGSLRLTGTRAISTLAGDLTVVRFNVSPQFDMAVAIAAAKAPPSPPDPTSWLNNLRLSLRVTSAPDLQLTTSLAKLAGDMSLNVRGTAIRPAVLGRINITEGQVSFNGATYQIDRGDITFSNPVKIEPVVDVAATTRVRDYDVTLGFHGPIDRLSTTYRSEPPLPTADIISLLAFGKTREESEMASSAQPTFSESASNAILGQALNAAVSNRVQRLFGVSRVKIAPDVGSIYSNPNARVTIEQQVSKDFTVTYITDLTRSNQQAIQVEYNYNRNVSIIGARDQYGIISFDVRWRQRKR